MAGRLYPLPPGEGKYSFFDEGQIEKRVSHEKIPGSLGAHNNHTRLW